MKQWFFENIPSFEAKVGFSTRFDIHSEDRVFPHSWKIVEVVDIKRIVYDWRYEGYKGACEVNFELFESENNTTLRLTSRAIESFTLDIPEFKRESAVGGWNYFINDRLNSYIKETF